ncbi:MAG: hypothetical protein B7Z75_08415 [Acidocella sp. 20-57-95]|nr:MAG: hypothetical protein B7Z75_08415 [Acidocella sp. 20-57-95]HQT64882.1 hypothetical protein [Acidocella sp.]
MVNVWIIVGESNTRKSSTIRALTGVRTQIIYDIQMIGGTQDKVLVIPSALQEYYRVQPAAFISYISKDQYIPKFGLSGPPTTVQNWSPAKINNILICLREFATAPTTTQPGCPDANAYISGFIRAKWTIKSPIIYLNAGTPTFSLPPALVHHISPPPPVHLINPLQPTNAIAAAIRPLWDWV